MNRVQPVRQGLQDLRGLKVIQDLKAILERQDHKDQRGRKDHKGLRVLPVRRV